MATKKVKFVAGAVVILGAVAYLAYSGIQEGKAYYQTVSEVKQLGARAQNHRLRVAGEVLDGSIVRREGDVIFTIHTENDQLPVRYIGKDPLPDTLVDQAQAVVEGYYQKDGHFEAHHVQAKCASKYEAEYRSRTGEVVATEKAEK